MNGTTRTLKKSRVLVTITPYTEQEKRVLNGSTTTATTTSNGTTNSTTNTTNSTVPIPPPPAPPLPLPAKTSTSEDSVEMQSIESFKLKDTPNPVIPKPPPTYFPLSNSSSTSTVNGSPRHVATSTGTKTQAKDKEQSTSPSNEITKTTTGNGVSSNGTTAGGPTPKAPAGKVAIRIGAYEGEAKQPSKLDFLAQQSRVEKSGSDESNGPVVSRLQNELAATLQRSNLRRKTEGDNQATTKSIPENTTTSEKETTNPEPNKLPQSTVEKLASALGNKVTIRVNPEDGSR